jgi:hypothetical protein
MILKIVDPVLSQTNFCAADQPSHQVFGFLTHFDVRWKVETILEEEKKVKKNIRKEKIRMNVIF